MANSSHNFVPELCQWPLPRRCVLHYSLFIFMRPCPSCICSAFVLHSCCSSFALSTKHLFLAMLRPLSLKQRTEPLLLLLGPCPSCICSAFVLHSCCIRAAVVLHLVYSIYAFLAILREALLRPLSLTQRTPPPCRRLYKKRPKRPATATSRPVAASFFRTGCLLCGKKRRVLSKGNFSAWASQKQFNT